MTIDSLLAAIHLPPTYTEADRYRDFRAVFGSDRGERVMASFLREAGLLATIYDVDGEELVAPDPDEIQRRLGKRELALWLIGVLSTEPLDPLIEEDDDGYSDD